MWLAAGERRGLRYHCPGGLVGDYDRPGAEEGVLTCSEELTGE